MLYQINVASQHYVFEDLKTLLAKATPERSGDQLAGIVATDATERVTAQMCLAEVPLQQFLQEAVVPYEEDEITRLIMMASFVNFVGLAGLIASFFSIIYAYSRQIFALSRAGYLPKKLSLTNSNHAPYLAIIIPGIIGFLLSLSGEGDLLILMAVFGATISYVLMMMSYIKLKLSRPNLVRPYQAPGGIVTASIALVLAAIAVVAGFLVDPKVWLMAAAIYVALILYFLLYSRHHLVAGTPEEEFARIEAAEKELK
nr:amino acid permease [Acinetobacter lwoffii]